MSLSAVQGTIEELAGLIDRCYVFPDVGARVSRDLLVGAVARNLDAEDPQALASMLTDYLRTATGDLHFSIHARRLTEAERSVPAEHRWKESAPDIGANFGFRSVEVVNGVGVLAITSLSPVRWTARPLHAAMAFCADAHAVVIDLRRCGGGDPDLLDLISSYFLGPEQTELSSVTWRDTGQVVHRKSDPTAVPFAFDPSARLFVVVGPGTASGAEGLAYELQALRRAVVVGQKTIGAAHMIKQFEVSGPFVATIPCGLVRNPVTGGDWEGVGVVPDVLVPEVDDALATAMALALRDRS